MACCVEHSSCSAQEVEDIGGDGNGWEFGTADAVYGYCAGKGDTASGEVAGDERRLWRRGRGDEDPSLSHASLYTLSSRRTHVKIRDIRTGAEMQRIHTEALVAHPVSPLHVSVPQQRKRGPARTQEIGSSVHATSRFPWPCTYALMETVMGV